MCTSEPQCGYEICVGLTDRALALTEICFISTAAVDDMNAWIILLCHNEGMPVSVMPSVIPSSSQLVKLEETESFLLSCILYVLLPDQTEMCCRMTYYTNEPNETQALSSHTTEILLLPQTVHNITAASRILSHTRLQMFHHSCKRNMATGTKSFKRAILHLIHGYFVIAIQTWLKRLHSLTTSGSHMVLYTCRLKCWNKPLENHETKTFFFFFLP